MKKIITFLLITSCTFCFSQTTILDERTIENNIYQIQSEIAKDYKNDEVKTLSVVRLVNDSIVSKCEVLKDNNITKDDVKLSFQVLDNAFVFEKTLNQNNGSLLYAIDRIYIDSKGNLFPSMNNGQFNILKADINTHIAEFDGGEKKLRSWVQNYFDVSDFYDFTDQPILKLFISMSIDENGKASVKEIKGTDSASIKDLVLTKINKMPNWIPAMEDSKKVTSSFMLPIHLTFGE